MSAASAPAAAPNEVQIAEQNVELAAEAATEVEAAVALSETPPAVVDEPAPAAGNDGETERRSDEAERQQAAARIRTSALLPPAIRDCLARVVEASGDAAGGQTRVPVDELVRAVEEAVPDFLRVDRRRTAAAAHPAGDAFFSGDLAGLSDREAEEIARGQLARSGLLRGQRVRVAD
jgi:hypothetical protein